MNVRKKEIVVIYIVLVLIFIITTIVISGFLDLRKIPEIDSQVLKSIFSIHRYASNSKVILILLVPIISIISILFYKRDVDKYHIFKVGKNQSYFKDLLKTKLTSALILCTIISAAYFTVAILFYLYHSDYSYINSEKPYELYRDFEMNSFSLFVLKRPLLTFMIDSLLVVSFSTFFTSYCFITIYEYFKKINVSIVIGLFVFVFASSFLYRIIPSMFVFSNAIFYNEANYIEYNHNFSYIYALTPYIIPTIIMMVLQWRNKHEII